MPRSRRSVVSRDKSLKVRGFLTAALNLEAAFFRRLQSRAGDGFGLDESLGRARFWLLRDGRRGFRFSTGVRCGSERLRQVAG
jgi:hypothetical protein